MVDIVEIELILLLTLTNGTLAAWLILHFTRNKLRNMLYDTMDDYITAKIDEYAENPAELQKIVTPLVKYFMSQLQPPNEASKDLRIMGYRIPHWALQLGLRMFGQKLGIPVAEEAKNPFE